MFCEACLRLLQRIKENPDPDPEGDHGNHHESYADFVDAVAHGCAICKRCQRKWNQNSDFAEDQEPASCIMFSYYWEKDAGSSMYYKSGFPARTVQIKFERGEKSTLQWPHQRPIPSPIMLNLVPVQSDQGSPI